MTREIHCEFELEASLEVVWQAIVEADEICRWFAPYTASAPGPDGFIGLGWKNPDNLDRMTFSAWEPPKRLVLDWHAAPQGVTPIHLPVEFRLEEKAGVTTLKLVQSGFLDDASWDDEYLSHARGWNTELRVLKHYLENFLGNTRHMFKSSCRLAGTDILDTLAGPAGVFRTSIRPADLAPGQTFELTLPDGTVTNSRLLYFREAMDFVCVCDALEGGIIRLSLESLASDPMLMFWTFSWQLGEQALTELASGWYEQVTDRLSETNARRTAER